MDTFEELQEQVAYNQLQIDAKNKEFLLSNIDLSNNLRNKRDNLQYEKDIEDLEISKELSDLNRKKRRLDIEHDIEHRLQKNKKQELELEIDFLKLKKEKAELLFDIEKQKLNQKSELIECEIKLREKELAKQEWAYNNAIRLPVPIVNIENNQLEIVLSDRIIELDGIITYSKADYVAVRLNYYNNQSDIDPIFIVINKSPGGSVMAGLEILANMESSIAPVYVVVRSWAASMAAIFVSRAERSYIYKDAQILHHQVLSFTIGNITQHEEKLKRLHALSKRTELPMLEKINARLTKLGKNDLWTYDTWIKAINSQDMTHDWTAYGDEAYYLGWVDNIVHRIRYTSQVRHPDAKYSIETKKDPPPAPPLPKKSSDNLLKLELEPLRPGDYYAIYQTHN